MIVSRSHFFCSIALLGALSTPLCAQDEPAQVYVPFEGVEAFAHILHSHDLKPLSGVDALAKAPAHETVAVIFGPLKTLHDLPAGFDWDSFLAGGGALLLASDYDDGGSLARWGLRLPNWEVKQRRQSSYQGAYSDCPWLSSDYLSTAHPVFESAKSGIATNKPRLLLRENSDLHLLAEFPGERQNPKDTLECWISGRSGNTPLPENAGYVFGSRGEAAPTGRMLVVAGQGMFMNGMVIQPDNDNFLVAWNAVRWLAEGPKGPRRYAMFLNEGSPVTKFDLPLGRQIPIPIPPVRIINQMLRGLENENIFNRLLVEVVGKEPVVRVFVLALTALFLLLGARRIVLSRYRTEHWAALVADDLTPPPIVPVEVERQQALLKRKNLWEAAQALARDFFLEHAGQAPSPLGNVMPTPAVELAGSWWQRRSLQKQLDDLWDLGQTQQKRRISPRAFHRFLDALAEMTAAALDGRVRFQNANLSTIRHEYNT
ncbi:MAG: hypothetical protein L0Y72_07280 [Gemmataceae bacterium]|nr:hypothetical protein [Gemmataceae bacterium]MCI0738829.1 hypothetical protein [Gemmataceae bacterium]